MKDIAKRVRIVGLLVLGITLLGLLALAHSVDQDMQNNSAQVNGTGGGSTTLVGIDQSVD